MISLGDKPLTAGNPPLWASEKSAETAVIGRNPLTIRTLQPGAAEVCWHSACICSIWLSLHFRPAPQPVFWNPVEETIAVSDQDSKFWSNAQTYSMAVICMILGIAAGYLLHAPAVASPTPSISEVSAPASPAAATPQMPSAVDMKRMADKQVAPLLADLEKHPNDPDLLAKIAHAYMAAPAVPERSAILREIHCRKAQSRCT